MKTIRLPYLLIGISALIAIVLEFGACKKDSNFKAGIAGTWNYDTKLTGYVQRESYQFNTDSTVLFTRAILDTTGKKVLGYNYKMTGKYSFDGTTVKLYQLTTYVDMDVTPLAYTTLQALQPVQTGLTTQSFTVKFNANYSAFTLIYPPCPPNANCIISSPIYIRQ